MVDAITMWFVKNPDWFDVVVASNLFGDIITDLGSMLQGGMGFAAVATSTRSAATVDVRAHSRVGPQVHRPEAGQPIASIEAMRMLLDHLGETDAADAIGRAVGSVLAAGEVRTRDLGGTNTTDELGRAVAAAVAAG